MSYVERHTVSITTDSSGDATGYTPVVTGKIVGVIYTKTDFADGVDFTITTETTGQGLWTDTNVNASETVYPKQQSDGPDGAAITGVYQHVYLSHERVKIVVAQGGDTKSGTFDVLVA